MSTLRVTLLQRVGSDELRNVFYVAGGFAIMDNAQDIVDYFRAAYALGSPSLADALHENWQMYGAEVKDVSDPENPVVPFLFTGGVINGGNNTSELLPLQTCFLVSFKSVTAPPNRARKYIGGWPESAHNTSGWTTTIVGIVQDWADYLLDMTSELDTGIALVVSRIGSGGVLVGSNILEQAIPTNYARIQRRRTPGRGI